MPVRVVDTSAPSQVSEGANSGQTSPQACTLLSVGQTFSGTQNVSGLKKDEAWRVNVCIQGCDLEHGYLCGTMEALNVPMADTPVRNLFSLHFNPWNYISSLSLFFNLCFGHLFITTHIYV
ncbi:uncharacterized protein LOC133802581 [Humulus lupulus]|uniref:uncharacterized protein LOC133802581 n=1 Tax=Humulus lupulus TaxID=3486 RepID=UPI002B4123AC|nr:uncharacterized protein LOC133802581 [Humulus lupulus]